MNVGVPEGSVDDCALTRVASEYGTTGFGGENRL